MNVTEFVLRVEWLRPLYRELGVAGGRSCGSSSRLGEKPLGESLTAGKDRQPTPRSAS